MNHLQICGRCAHAYDHIGKRCTDVLPNGEPCPCTNAVRTDVLQCRQNVEIINGLETLVSLLMFIHKVEVNERGAFIRRPDIELTH